VESAFFGLSSAPGMLFAHVSRHVILNSRYSALCRCWPTYVAVCQSDLFAADFGGAVPLLVVAASAAVGIALSGYGLAG
jgi:hypothetical protein